VNANSKRDGGSTGSSNRHSNSNTSGGNAGGASSKNSKGTSNGTASGTASGGSRAGTSKNSKDVSVSAAAPSNEKYVVTTSANDEDEFVIKMLVGEFSEKGENHGRKYYKKSSEKNVFLYYWDHRDGSDYEGWWFGKEVGGNEVWSHNQSNCINPPSCGWKIPFSGPVRETLSVKSNRPRSPAEEEADKLDNQISEVLRAAASALEQARTSVGDNASLQALQEADDMLSPHVSSLTEMQNKIPTAVSGNLLEVSKQQTQRVRMALMGVNSELARIRASRPKAVEAEKAHEMEQKDLATLQDWLTEATNKANNAEDLIEKTASAFQTIEHAGENQEETKAAIDETERLATSAQTTVGEALAYVGGKLATSRRFESEHSRKTAATELAKLRTQLQEAHRRLVPLKNVRQDLNQKTLAKKIVQEVLGKLAPAEKEIDKAEEALKEMDGTSGGAKHEEGMQQMEQSISEATNQLNEATRVIESQQKLVSIGPVVEELRRFEERTKSAMTRINGLKNRHKEIAESDASVSLLKDTSEKLKAAQDAVNKANDALTAQDAKGEGHSIDGMIASAKSGEAVVTIASKVVATARVAIAVKLVEVKRFSAGSAQNTLRQLQDYQAQLEAAIQKLNDLKNLTAQRKTMALTRELEVSVSSAESLVNKLAEAAACVADDTQISKLDTQELRDVMSSLSEALIAATKGVDKAQELVTARQIEAKGKDELAELGPELAKFQARLRIAHAEAGRYKALPETMEKHVVMRYAIEDANAKVIAAEEKMTKAEELIKRLAELPPEVAGAEGNEGLESHTKAAEEAVSETQICLKTAMRYLDTQARSQSLSKDELAKWQPRLREVEKRLDVASTSIRIASEKLVVTGILRDIERRMKEAEEAVQKASQAAVPFLDGNDEAAPSNCSEALKKLDSAVSAAQSAIENTKTLFATKRVAAKRLSERGSSDTLATLSSMQSTLDSLIERLVDICKGCAVRRMHATKNDLLAKVTQLEGKVRATTEAADSLVHGAVLEPNIMTDMLEKAGHRQQEAQDCIAAARSTALEQLRDLKTAPADSGLAADFKLILENLVPLQAQLEITKKQVQTQEETFVAKKLLKGVEEMFEVLEGKLEKAMLVAAPLIEQTPDLIAEINLTSLVSALKGHMKKQSTSPEILFTTMCGGTGILTRDAFVSFVKSLPEVILHSDVLISEQRLKDVFSCLDIKGGGEVALEDFMEHLHLKYMCTTGVSMTDALNVEGSKTICKLEVGDVVQLLEDPATDSGTGLQRMRARTEKNGAVGFLTVAGNQGTAYVEVYSPYESNLKTITAVLQEASDSVSQAFSFLKQKSEEINSARDGPLADLKTHLMKMRVRASKAQNTHTSIEKRVAEARRNLEQQLQAERKSRHEEAEKVLANTLTDEANAMVANCEQEANSVSSRADSVVSSQGSGSGLEVKTMEEILKDLEVVIESIHKADSNMFKGKLDEVKVAQKGPFSDARKAFLRLKAKLTTLESKCKKHFSTIREKRLKVLSDARDAMVGALRDHVYSSEVSLVSVFEELSSDGAKIELLKLRTFFEGLAETRFEVGTLDAALYRYQDGVTNLEFMEMAQEYRKCVKEIAITTAFETKSSHTLRKLEVGEIVKITGKLTMDTKLGVERARCTALADQAEGWVTLQGNQGTPFLEPVAMPLYTCEVSAPLFKDLGSGTGKLRDLMPGEILEVLEGPRREPPTEVTRANGKAIKDGAVGWVTLKDSCCSMLLEPSRQLVCQQSTALTTAFDVENCTSLRKLEAGEVFEQLEEPQEDPLHNIVRIKLRARSDGREGWATMTGNYGTTYIVERLLYEVGREPLALEHDFATGSQVVRQLEEGEMFEVLDNPTVKMQDGLLFMRGRSLSSGTFWEAGDEGWFRCDGSAIRPWSRRCCSRKTIDLHCDRDSSCKQVVRSLKEGEILDVIEVPALEPPANAGWVRVRAEKDCAVGFISVRASDGEAQLMPPPLIPGRLMCTNS